MNKVTVFFLALICVFPSSAFAYVGPGMGVGALGVLIGILGSICLAIFAIVYYPVKRVLKKRKANAVMDDLDEADVEATENIEAPVEKTTHKQE